jgi:hypothetical protein
MVDIQTVSIAIATTSVVIGVVYYVLQLRHQDRMRHLDLFMRLYSTWGSRDFLDAHRRFMTIKVEDYDSFVEKHGPVTDSSQLYTDIDQVGWFFNLMGFLVKERIVNIKQVDELLGYWVLKNWETIMPLLYGWRKQYNIPESYHWFEYLYNEMKKYEQQLQKGVENG